MKAANNDLCLISLVNIGLGTFLVTVVSTGTLMLMCLSLKKRVPSSLTSHLTHQKRCPNKGRYAVYDWTSQSLLQGNLSWNSSIFTF